MKTLRFSALVLVLLLATGLSGCLTVPVQYAVSGQVTDAETGLGIAGVTVSFSGGFAPVVTGADGTWTKGGLRGLVEVRASRPGYRYSPASAVVRGVDLDVDFASAAMPISTVFWYSTTDYAHFDGACEPIEPTSELTSIYDVTVNNSSVQATVPEGFDVLVLSDTGAGFDIRDFEGQVIVTLDSSISPLFYWLTGNSTQSGPYWDYDTEESLTWVTPALGTEPGYEGDARVFHSLETGLPMFTRRNDLLEAYSTSDADDIVIYEIATGDGSWWWVHVGPAHIGDARVSDIVRYALDLISEWPSALDPISGVMARAAGTARQSNN